MRNTGLVAIASCVLALFFAAGLVVNAPPATRITPPPYTPDTHLDNGLVARIHFSKDVYLTLDTVNASYDYYNPLKTSVTFTPPNMYSTEAGYLGDDNMAQRGGGVVSGPVTLAPGETFSTNVSWEVTLVPGTFYVKTNGTMGTVQVTQGPLVARMSTDKQSYVVGGGGGTATLEIYNSGTQSLTYENFSPLELRHWYIGESPSNTRSMIFVSWFTMYTTVQPGETHKVMSLSFDTPKAGTIILDFNGVQKTVQVLSR